jgi:hypothetical protein
VRRVAPVTHTGDLTDGGGQVADRRVLPPGSENNQLPEQKMGRQGDGRLGNKIYILNGMEGHAAGCFLGERKMESSSESVGDNRWEQGGKGRVKAYRYRPVGRCSPGLRGVMAYRVSHPDAGTIAVRNHTVPPQSVAHRPPYCAILVMGYNRTTLSVEMNRLQGWLG